MTLPLGAADAKPSIIELCYLRMRNTQDSMAQRTNDFLANSYVPAVQRAGAKRIGAFTNVIGEDNPRTLLVTEYPDICSVGRREQKTAEMTKNWPRLPIHTMLDRSSTFGRKSSCCAAFLLCHPSKFLHVRLTARRIFLSFGPTSPIISVLSLVKSACSMKARSRCFANLE